MKSHEGNKMNSKLKISYKFKVFLKKILSPNQFFKIVFKKQFIQLRIVKFHKNDL